MQRKKLVDWILFVVLSVIWGSSFILMKISREHLNGYQIGAVRILSAGIFFLPFGVYHLKKIPVKKIPLVGLSGLLANFFPAFLFAIAIEKIDSSLEGILNSLTPLFVIIIGVLYFKTGVQPKKVAGVLLGFVGLVMLSFSSGFSASNYGYALLILLATFFYGLNVNLINHYLKTMHPLHMATVSLSIVSLPALLVVLQQQVFFLLLHHPEAWWSFAANVLLGVMGSAVATLLFYMLIKRAGGLFASLVTYAIPVVAIFWGLLSGEHITLLQVFCLAIILGGVYLGNK